jgi:hypothetical protein
MALSAVVAAVGRQKASVDDWFTPTRWHETWVATPMYCWIQLIELAPVHIHARGIAGPTMIFPQVQFESVGVVALAPSRTHDLSQALIGVPFVLPPRARNWEAVQEDQPPATLQKRGTPHWLKPEEVSEQITMFGA